MAQQPRAPARRNRAQDNLNADKRAVLLVLYQQAGQLFVTEANLIWNRTGAFIFFNTLIVTSFYYLSERGFQGSLLISFVVAIFGVGYSFLWFFSMKRSWEYHDDYLGLMKRQEQELNRLLGAQDQEFDLRALGPLLSNIEHFTNIARARNLTYAIPVFFFIIYLLLLIMPIWPYLIKQP